MGVNCDFCKIDIKTTSSDHSACSRDFLLNLSAGELIPSIREMRNIRYDSLNFTLKYKNISGQVSLFLHRYEGFNQDNDLPQDVEEAKSFIRAQFKRICDHYRMGWCGANQTLILLEIFFRHGYICLMPTDSVGNKMAEASDTWIENELSKIENLERTDPNRGKRFENLINKIFR